MCWLVGQYFVMVAWIIEVIIDRLYAALRYFVFSLTLGSQWLYRRMGRIQGNPPKRYFRHLWKPVMWARRNRTPFNIRPIWECRVIAATQLLKQRYGIVARDTSTQSAADEMGAWLQVLGVLPQSVREGVMASRIVLASAVAMLTIIYAAPILRNRYVITSSVVLVVTSLLQTAVLTRSRRVPLRANLINLAMLMAELREMKPKGSKSTDDGSDFCITSTDDDESD
jgi:hypothetical protein